MRKKAGEPGIAEPLGQIELIYAVIHESATRGSSSIHKLPTSHGCRCVPRKWRFCPEVPLKHMPDFACPDDLLCTHAHRPIPPGPLKHKQYSLALACCSDHLLRLCSTHRQGLVADHVFPGFQRPHSQICVLGSSGGHDDGVDARVGDDLVLASGRNRHTISGCEVSCVVCIRVSYSFQLDIVDAQQSVTDRVC
jgi:hypothetical protein